MYPAPVPGAKQIFFKRARTRLSEMGAAWTSFPPTQLFPLACAQSVNPHVGLLRAFDRPHPDQHDEPLGIFHLRSTFSARGEFRKVGRAEKLQKILARLTYPPLRNHAPSATFLH